jgi:hypothetical protein
MGTETTPSGIMGRWQKNGNHFSPNNKLVQELEGNEENGYQYSDYNKTQITYTKDPMKPTRTF